MSDSFILVLTTLPTLQKSRRLARLILENKLAACVTVLGPAESLYWWKNKIDNAKEYVLLIKSRSSLYSRLETFIHKNHPYSVPEIISLRMDKGSKPYLDWLLKNT